MQIALDPFLSDSDRALAVRYLLQPRLLTSDERLRALRVFDELGASTITADEQTQTFAAFYRAQIDAQYADAFLDQLLAADATEVRGHQLLRQTWQQIVSDFRTMGVQLSGDIGQQCLVAFCGYWWSSFGKGYIREVAVFRDLERSGVAFVAHDLRQRRARFSPYDLTALAFAGTSKPAPIFYIPPAVIRWRTISTLSASTMLLGKRGWILPC